MPSSRVNKLKSLKVAKSKDEGGEGGDKVECLILISLERMDKQTDTSKYWQL